MYHIHTTRAFIDGMTIITVDVTVGLEESADKYQTRND